MTTIVTRSAQLLARTNDPFSPLQVDSSTEFNQSTLSYFTNKSSTSPSDTILDGVPIVGKSSSEIWEEENKLHGARSLSNAISSTKMFLGRQVIAIRDDINLITHAAFVEHDALVKISLKNGQLISREIIRSGHTQRVHICLNKYGGELFVLHASANNGNTLLFLKNKIVPTSSSNVDFPYMVFSQTPIGHIQTDEPEYAIISYKCRSSGKLYYRIMRNGKVGEEKELRSPQCLGGVDFEIKHETVLFRIDAIKDGVLVPMVAQSNDGGASVTDFSPIPLTGYDLDAVLPEGGGIVKDHLGNFHIPVTVLKGESRFLLDVLPDDTIVEAMQLSQKGYGTTLAAFPKKPDKTISFFGRGDGVSDGTGIIAVGLEEGKLFSSNSQAGGINFPPARLLNHEMQKIFAFKPTDNCYTKSHAPNTVSMDYFYLEADEVGNPVSQELFIESWDMPLPVPAIRAVAVSNTIEIEIIKDGWFEVGKTTFDLSDPSVAITDVIILNGRKAVITCDKDKLTGLMVAYEMRNIFYWQQSITDVK